MLQRFLPYHQIHRHDLFSCVQPQAISHLLHRFKTMKKKLCIQKKNENVHNTFLETIQTYWFCKACESRCHNRYLSTTNIITFETIVWLKELFSCPSVTEKLNVLIPAIGVHKQVYIYIHTTNMHICKKLC